MFRYFLSFMLGAIVPFIGYGQDISGNIDYLTDNLENIASKKSEFSQSFGIQKGEDEQCMVWYQKTPAGKGAEERFEFNAADLNENRISFDTRKDLVIISAAVKGKKDLIRKREDGEIEGYTDEVKLYASSIEDARKLVEELKAMATGCSEKMEQNSGLGEEAGKQELLDYLTENIKEVEINDERYEQSFAYDPQQSSLITYTLNDVGESERYIYKLNTMDLNFAKVDFNTNRAKIVINTETKAKRSLIQVEKNDQLENYASKMQLMAPNIESARNLAAVLKALAKISSKEGETAMTLRSDNDPAAALDYLAENIGEVVINDDVYKQSFSSDSENPFMISYELEDIDKEKIESLRFNLSDLDPSSVDFDVSRNAVFVKAQVQGKKNLIQESEEKVITGYENDLSIRVADIETARIMRSQLLLAVKHYRENKTDYFSNKYPSPSLQDAIAYSESAVEKVTVGEKTYVQTFQVGKDGDCLAQIEIEDVDKGEIKGFSFNWSDINPSKISFSTKGKDLFVMVETKGRKELIEATKDGETDDFERSFQLRCSDVESARALAAAWKVLAKSCSDK